MKGIVLNDYGLGRNYATMVMEGKKLIETRMNRRFSYRGDLVICCGATNSVTQNAGKALCIVNLWKVRVMRESDVEAAGIECHHKRYSHLLKDWRHFDKPWEFKDYAIQKNFQGIFDIAIPEGIKIIPRPDIIPFREYLTPQEAVQMIKDDDTYDFLNYKKNEITGKWEIRIGKREGLPIEIFDTEDEADVFVNRTHEILSRIRSARALRSMFSQH